MSPPSPSRRPVRVVLALAVGATSLVGLSQASAAPPVTFAVTGVSPAYVEAGVTDAFGVTLTGKGFGRDTVVKIDGCNETVVTVPPTTVTATKLVVKPPKCDAGTVDITVTKGAATTAPSSVLKQKLTFLATPVVEALAPATAVSPAAAPWSGGTAAVVTVKEAVPAKAAVQVRFVLDGVTRAVPGKVDATNAKRISFKVPSGVPGGTPEVGVSVAGILSAAVPDLFTWKSTIRTTPAVWVKGAAAPTVKIDGAGFSKGKATVTICDKAADPAPGKAPTDRTLYVTAPAWSAEDGQVCAVEVVVAGGETSVLTAGSTFTYAAY